MKQNTDADATSAKWITQKYSEKDDCNKLKSKLQFNFNERVLT